MSREGIGRLVWIGSSLGLIGAGMTIMFVGMTEVFVPSDLAFVGYTREELHAINPRLVPLIAHDRAGFGGGVLTTGILLLGIIWKAPPSVHAWQVVVVSAFAGAVQEDHERIFFTRFGFRRSRNAIKQFRTIGSREGFRYRLGGDGRCQGQQ